MGSDQTVVRATTAERVASPSDLGFDAERLGRLGAAIEKDIAIGRSDGVVMLIARRGQIVFHEAFGYAERETERPMSLDSVIATASTFKQLTNATVLQRIERGDFSLTTQVAEVIPEYAARGKQRTTVSDLLCHTAGLPFDRPSLPFRELGDIGAVTAYVCGLAPEAEPGTAVRYSAMAGHSVLAEIVRRVDGGRRPFRQILTEDLLKPLGMHDTCLGGRHDLMARYAPPVFRDMTPGLFAPSGPESEEVKKIRYADDFEVPAGMGMSTPYDFFRFAEACRRGGELDGRRVLGPATIRRARTIATGDMPNGLWVYAREMRGWREFPANLGPGFFVRGEGIFPHPFGTLASPSTYGGFGSGTNCFWVDPDRELVSVFFSVGGVEESRSVERHGRYSDMVQAALVDIAA